jgi:sulfate adenylyltransferase
LDRDLLARDAPRHDKLATEAETLPAIVLTERQLCDLELLLSGGFSPLEGMLDGGANYPAMETERVAAGRIHAYTILCRLYEREGLQWVCKIYANGY